MPAQDPFLFLTVYIISMSCVLSLTQMLILLSLYVMLSILLSFRSVRSQVCSVLVWSVSRARIHESVITYDGHISRPGITELTSKQALRLAGSTQYWRVKPLTLALACL